MALEKIRKSKQSVKANYQSLSAKIAEKQKELASSEKGSFRYKAAEAVIREARKFQEEAKKNYVRLGQLEKKIERSEKLLAAKTVEQPKNKNKGINQENKKSLFTLENLKKGLIFSGLLAVAILAPAFLIPAFFVAVFAVVYSPKKSQKQRQLKLKKEQKKQQKQKREQRESSFFFDSPLKNILFFTVIILCAIYAPILLVPIFFLRAFPSFLPSFSLTKGAAERAREHQEDKIMQEVSNAWDAKRSVRAEQRQNQSPQGPNPPSAGGSATSTPAVTVAATSVNGDPLVNSAVTPNVLAQPEPATVASTAKSVSSPANVALEPSIVSPVTPSESEQASLNSNEPFVPQEANLEESQEQVLLKADTPPQNLEDDFPVDDAPGEEQVELREEQHENHKNTGEPAKGRVKEKADDSLELINNDLPSEDESELVGERLMNEEPTSSAAPTPTPAPEKVAPTNESNLTNRSSSEQQASTNVKNEETDKISALESEKEGRTAETSSISETNGRNNTSSTPQPAPSSSPSKKKLEEGSDRWTPQWCQNGWRNQQEEKKKLEGESDSSLNSSPSPTPTPTPGAAAAA